MSKSEIIIKIYTNMNASIQYETNPKVEQASNLNVIPLIASDFIFIRDKDCYRKVYFKDILYIKADGVYSEVKTIDNQFLISNCLRKVLEQLNCKSIIRCHRSYAININQVDAYLESLLVLGKAKKEIPVGLKFKSDIFKRFPVLRSQ